MPHRGRIRCSSVSLAATILVCGSAGAQPIVYVDADAPQNGDGTSWTTAYAHLQDALATATAGDEIRVADGVYKPDRDEAGSVTLGDRRATFQLVTGVAIYGGYAGLSSVDDPNQRDRMVYTSVLSGDLSGDDEPEFLNSGENSFHVVSASGVGASAILDGFTISGGYSGDQMISGAYGAGIFNEGGTATLKDCTVAGNKAATKGGGIFNLGGHLTIIDCDFIENETRHSGGGICNETGDAVITGCTFRGNSAHLGGGISNFESGLSISHSLFTENFSNQGSGINSIGGSFTARHCTFTRNSSDSSSAGISVQGGNPIVVACTFTGNTTRQSAAALYFYHANAKVYNCTFEGNTAGGSCGALMLHGGTAFVANCSFNGNRSEYYAGAIWNSFSAVSTFANCTITGNVSGKWGGGIYNDSQSALTLTNCILWNNADSRGTAHPGGQIAGTVLANVNYSCVQDAAPHDGRVFPGEGNIDVNPGLVDPDGPDGVPGSGDEDLGLFPRSPCIDAGHNESLSNDAGDVDDDEDRDEPVPLDLNGDPRWTDEPCVADVGQPDPTRPELPTLDMGAFEFQGETPGDPDSDGIADCDDNCPMHANSDQADCDSDGRGDVCQLELGRSGDCNDNDTPDECDLALGNSFDLDADDVPDECESVHYVDDDAPTGGDGASWETAFVYLQDALATAKRGDQIHVAEGIYQPDLSERGNATARDREASFMLLDGVKLLGGFAGPGNPTDPDGRDVDVYPSTLTGDLLANDETGGGTFDNSDHVVAGGGRDRTAIIDGFTITAGAENNGGGIYIFAGSPTVSNCRFIKNTRGMFSFTFSSPRVTHCRFEENSSTGNGSGIYISSKSDLVVEHCTFVRNSAREGGAVYVTRVSDAQLVGCIFRENSAAFGGGAVGAYDSTLLLLDCAFLGNTTPYRGGAVSANLAAPTIVNSVFSGNTALENGGAVAMRNQSDVTLINCSFAGNFAPVGRAFGSESSSQNMPSAVTLRNCIVRNGIPEVFSRDGTVYSMSYSNVSGGWSGIGNIDTYARFVREPDHGGDGWGDNPDTPDVDERANNDYGDLRLSFGSPCIDRGELGFVSEFSETDLDGHARILGARVDMGAYEFGIADFDRNGIIDLKDVARLQTCFGDPKGGPYANGCEAFDFEFDRDVDLEDHAAFLNVFDP